MRVLVTGADGFIGKNLSVRLAELADVEVLPIVRSSSDAELLERARTADFVFHLAGINRPQDPLEFEQGNVGFTRRLIEALHAAGARAPVLYTSSIQAALDVPYGRSKRAAEDILRRFSADTGTPAYIYRLPNVFGKWCRPNYNSVVATFCHNVTRDLPIQVNDANAALRLVYVDDVIQSFIDKLQMRPVGGECQVEPVYTTTLGELAGLIRAFKESRATLLTEKVGTGFVRALYATYVSYLEPARFSYALTKHEDPRGMFVEMLKTQDSGQFSYFTAHPGVTRGGHYHHTKTEKFLVVKGRARFRFKHMVSGEFYELDTSGDVPQIVETIPGWAHDITNVGDDEMAVLLWANEIFDRQKPDTVARSCEN